MIKINGVEVKKENFLSGELRLVLPFHDDLNGEGEPKRNAFPFLYEGNCNQLIAIFWNYEDDSELFALKCIVKHIRNMYPAREIYLYLPYIPHARMDRVEDDYTVFTLKWFCEEINSMNFDVVFVLDAHSNVSLALLDRVQKTPVTGFIYEAISKCSKSGNLEAKPQVVLYFPDDGAYKRYRHICDTLSTGDEDGGENFIKIYGSKVRDWKTGKIQSLDIKTEQGSPYDINEIAKNPNVCVLMIDDIVSYGGTMYYSALKLKEMGFQNIFAYASHTENSVLDREHGTLIKLLDDGTVKKLYTTNSIFTGKHPSIEIL